MIRKITKKAFGKYWKTLASMTSRVLATVKTKSTPSEALGKAIQKSEEALAVLNNAITRVRRNDFTIQAHAADANRDVLYRALALRLESDMLCYYDPQVQQSAKDLYEIIVNIGRSLKPGDNDESNQLANLFKMFDKHIESFQNNTIENIYSNLKKAEREFLDIQEKVITNFQDKKTIPNIRKAADNLIDQLNEKLIPRLTMEAEDNPGQYDEAINLINGIIEKTENVQRTRIARNDSTDEPVEITEETEVSAT
jgi:tetratricopeptide (TPR) repeat protein